MHNINHLDELIREYIKDKTGDAHLYGLIFLLIGSNLYLPDELARHLLVIHHANHWIPLMTEDQRIACFNELLNNADTHKNTLI